MRCTAPGGNPPTRGAPRRRAVCAGRTRTDVSLRASVRRHLGRCDRSEAANSPRGSPWAPDQTDFGEKLPYGSSKRPCGLSIPDSRVEFTEFLPSSRHAQPISHRQRSKFAPSETLATTSLWRTTASPNSLHEQDSTFVVHAPGVACACDGCRYRIHERRGEFVPTVVEMSGGLPHTFSRSALLASSPLFAHQRLKSLEKGWHGSTASESSELGLGSEQTGRTPALPHITVTPSSHESGYAPGDAQGRFNRIRRSQRATQRD